MIRIGKVPNVKDTGGVIAVCSELGELFTKSTIVLSSLGRSTTIPCYNFLHEKHGASLQEYYAEVRI